VLQRVDPCEAVAIAITLQKSVGVSQVGTSHEIDVAAIFQWLYPADFGGRAVHRHGELASVVVLLSRRQFFKDDRLKCFRDSFDGRRSLSNTSRETRRFRGGRLFRRTLLYSDLFSSVFFSSVFFCDDLFVGLFLRYFFFGVVFFFFLAIQFLS
jgi:hypothetical protein